MSDRISQIKKDGDKLFPVSLFPAIKKSKSSSFSLEDIYNSIPYVKTEEDGFYICDTEGNCVFSINANGVSSIYKIDDTTLDMIVSFLKDNYLTEELSKYTDNSILYVSQSGDDTNDGSISYPVKSIQQAIDLAELQPSKDVKIIISGGTYSIENTITINSSKNITIENDGYDVNINSLQSVDFTETSTGSGIYKSTKSGFNPMWLYINGEKILSASTQRPSYFSRDGMISIPISSERAYYIDDEGNKITIEGSTGGYVSDSNLYEKKLYCDITLSSTDIQALANADVYKHVIIHIYTKWTSKLSKIIAIDTINNVITIPFFNNKYDSPMPMQLDKVLIENIEIPLAWNGSKSTFVAGTFYYDNDGYIYYKKNVNETVSSMKVASLDTAFIVNSPTKFNKLKISGFNYSWFNSDGLCPDRQSGYMLDSAMKVYSGNVYFENCKFTDIEGGCISFYNGSHDCTVNKCHFHEIGAYGIRFGEWHARDVTPDNLIYNCTASNNIVCNFGKVFEQSSGIIIFYSRFTRVIHNNVFLGYYTGITAGYNWNDLYVDDTDLQRVYGGCINYNNVSCLNGGLLQDFGCLYLAGKFENNFEVVGNELSYAQSTNWLSMGIYSEGDCKFVTYKNNLVYKCITGFFSNKCNYYTVFKNNACYACQTALKNSNYNLNIVIDGNIFCQTSTELPTKNANDTYTNNIFFSTGGTLDLSVFGASNFNLNPGFTDAGKGDFSIVDKTNVNNIGWKDNTFIAGVLDSSMKNILNLYAIEIANFKALYD